MLLNQILAPTPPTFAYVCYSAFLIWKPGPCESLFLFSNRQLACGGP